MAATPLAPVISLEDRRALSGNVSANYLEKNFPGNQDVVDTYMPEGESLATVIDFPAHAIAIGKEALRIANQDEFETVIVSKYPQLGELLKQFEGKPVASFGTTAMNAARAETEHNQK